MADKGFDGSIGETDWAAYSAYLGAQYCVRDAADLKVTVVASADRTVQVAPGTGYGAGVASSFATASNVQLPIVTSGSRWDTIVLRRDWTAPDPGGSSVIATVTGNATKKVTRSLTTPGNKDDQVLAIVRVTAGQTVVQEVADRRVWAAKTLYTEDLTSIVAPLLGQQVTLIGSGVTYRRELDGSGNAAWLKDRGALTSVTATEYTGSQVITTLAGWNAGAPLVTRALVIGNMVQLDIALRRTGTAFSANTDAQVASITPDFAPDRLTLVNVKYYNAGRGTFGGLMQLDSGGKLSTLSGYPDQDIAVADAGDPSLIASAFYIRKVA